VKNISLKKNIVRVIVFIGLCTISYMNMDLFDNSYFGVAAGLIVYFIVEFFIGFVWENLKVDKK